MSSVLKKAISHGEIENSFLLKQMPSVVQSALIRFAVGIIITWLFECLKSNGSLKFCILQQLINYSLYEIP